MLHEARVTSASLANLAELELDAIGALIKLGLRRELLAEAIDRGIENSDFGWLILYVLRRQLGGTRSPPRSGGRTRWAAPTTIGCRLRRPRRLH